MLLKSSHPALSLRGSVYVTTAQPRYSDQEYEGLLSAISQIYAAVDEPFVMLVDARELIALSSDQLRRVIEMDRLWEQTDRLYCRGQGFVVTSGLTRGIVAAWHWVLPPVYATQTFTQLDAAWLWAEERMRMAPRPTTNKQRALRRPQP